MKKRFQVLIFVLALVLSAVPGLAQPSSAEALACPQKPFMTLSTKIDVAGKYAVWLLEKRDAGSTAKVYVSDGSGTDCSEMAKHSSTTNWGWISGSSGTASMPFTAGDNQIRIYVDGGTTNLATLLLTLETGCKPVNDDTNCVDLPIAFNVGGILQDATVSGDVVVETYIQSKTTELITVEYYLDNAATPYATTSSAPYCMVTTNGACASWPSASIGNGDHSLRVRASGKNDSKELTITFKVNNSTTSVPAPTTSVPVALPGLSPAEQEALENRGTEKKDEKGTNGIIKKIADSLEEKEDEAFIAGSTHRGALKGLVVIAPPKALRSKKGDTVELLVGGKVVETKKISSSDGRPEAFTLDTTKLKNGRTIIAIRGEQIAGGTSTHSSNVEISNGTVASVIGYVKETWPKLLLYGLSAIVGIVSLTYIIRRYIHKKNFAKSHNLDTEYVYPHPQHRIYATATAAIAVFTALGSFYLIGNSSNAANVGYILPLTNATLSEEFGLASDPGTDLAFVKMSDTKPTTPLPGQTVDTGHTAHTPTTTPTTPTPAPVPQPTTSSSYQSNLNMILASASRNKNFDNARLVNTPSVNLYNDQSLYGNPNDYAGHGAYNPGTISPGGGMFRTECSFSHFSYDDAIVYPGKPGAAHLHMNFGNTHNNAYSNYSTLINSGNGTCSGGELNRTAYWVPAMMDDRGNARVPERMLIYYKAQGPIVGSVTPYPENLRFLINSSVSLAANNFTFSCYYSDPRSVVTVNCAGGALHLVLAFPRCLKDGADVTDYANNWTTQTGGWWWSSCPAGSQALPLLEYNIFYPVEPGEDSSRWYLSSDIDRTTKQKTAANGNSVHGDWFGGWNKQINQEFINNCLNNTAVINSTGAECGLGSLIPCIRASANFSCEQYASGLPMRALKAINPYPGYNKVPLSQIHSEVCPQAPLPSTASNYEYAYCVNP